MNTIFFFIILVLVDACCMIDSLIEGKSHGGGSMLIAGHYDMSDYART